MLSVLVYIAMAGEALAVPDKVSLELQQRCGRLASAEFKKEFGAPGVPQMRDGEVVIYNFQNHYNSRLSSCVYMIRVTVAPITSTSMLAETAQGYEMMSLHDLHRNRELGRFFKFKTTDSYMDCEVGKRACSSREEWESLIRPLLEE